MVLPEPDGPMTQTTSFGCNGQADVPKHLGRAEALGDSVRGDQRHIQASNLTCGATTRKCLCYLLRKLAWLLKLEQ